MAIPVPTVPSAVEAVSAVSLKSTLNNKSFYIYSGLIAVDNTETTLISINDIGKRDIFLCVEVGSDDATADNYTFKLKVNGTIVFARHEGNNNFNARSMMQFIIPANTSVECTLDNIGSATANDFTIACYGTYLEGN